MMDITKLSRVYTVRELNDDDAEAVAAIGKAEMVQDSIDSLFFCKILIFSFSYNIINLQNHLHLLREG